MESEASFTVQQVLVSSILLYLCTCNPSGPHPVGRRTNKVCERLLILSFCLAPFAIDTVSKFL
ncbi:hypothetical protein LY76DRAFT_596916 [Colletotrichum caudatum]|nr:hypothetical protein LY76DRAFT_596916 [Colletotrichum caudatum]